MIPELSIIVCTYNRSNLLLHALQSLAEQSLEKSKYEVIVVDNNSVDQTEEVTCSFINLNPNTRYIKETKQGLSNARNRGYMEARGKYVAYIDDDARAFPDWAEKIVKAFETVTPKPVAVGGEIHPWWEKTPPSWFMNDYEIRSFGTMKGFLRPPRAQYGFSGSNMAFRKSILELYGGFSTKYGMIGNKARVGDETALFFRIYPEHPYFWYDPTIRVKHWVPVRNMSVRHILKRAFIGGEAITSIHQEISSSSLKRTLFFIIFNSYTLPFRVYWWQRHWQRDFLKQAVPLARAFGSLKSIIQNKQLEN